MIVVTRLIVTDRDQMITTRFSQPSYMESSRLIHRFVEAEKLNRMYGQNNFKVLLRDWEFKNSQSRKVTMSMSISDRHWFHLFVRNSFIYHSAQKLFAISHQIKNTFVINTVLFFFYRHNVYDFVLLLFITSVDTSNAWITSIVASLFLSFYVRSNNRLLK